MYTSTEELPVIELAPFLEFLAKKSSNESNIAAVVEEEELDPQLKELCGEVSECLRETGALVVRDPRCSATDNDRFIKMMESYFNLPDDFKNQQVVPQSHYQIGATPGGLEIPLSLVDEQLRQNLREMPKETRPSIPTGPDLKWRYMWRIGPQPCNTRFKELNFESPIPEGFPEWKDIMDCWGYKMVDAIRTVAEMAAIGFGLPRDAFTSILKEGPCLLAPTGSDLGCYTEEGTVFAGYHYDINFLTIHGRNRFPGLNIWLKNGEKLQVKVPVGCLLIQTGKQIEYLTAGECKAGAHEVVVTGRTIEAVEKAKKQNQSLWRVSSTLFANIASDAVLKPLGHFANSPLAGNYPSMFAGDFVKRELSAINLK